MSEIAPANARVVVTAGGERSDIDVLACAIAYAELLRLRGLPATAVIAPKFTMSVTRSILELNLKYETDYIKEEMDEYVLVDISDPDHFAKFVDHGKIVGIFDHRDGYQEHWQQKLGENSHIELVGSCGTLIWEEFNRQERESISIESAKLLFASIVSNTLNLRSSVTTDRDRQALKELQAISRLDDAWVTNYYVEQEEQLMVDFEAFLEADTKVIEWDSRKIVIGQLELWDAKVLLQSKKTEIERVLSRSGDNWFLTIPSISDGSNYIYATNSQMKNLLIEKLGVDFKEEVAQTNELLMRKQIIQKLKQ